jgi:WD40 repeat protein
VVSVLLRWDNATAGRGVVRVWDAATGAARHTIDTGHPCGVGSVVIAPDGRWLASTGYSDVLGGSDDRVVRVWDTATGTPGHTIDTGHPCGVGSVVIAPDGRWLATTGFGDPVVRLWNRATGAARHTIDTGHPAARGRW